MKKALKSEDFKAFCAEKRQKTEMKTILLYARMRRGMGKAEMIAETRKDSRMVQPV